MNPIDPNIPHVLPEPKADALPGLLPRWEELPHRYQQELIETLAALLLQQPQLQALRETTHEPQP